MPALDTTIDPTDVPVLPEDPTEEVKPPYDPRAQVLGLTTQVIPPSETWPEVMRPRYRAARDRWRGRVL